MSTIVPDLSVSTQLRDLAPPGLSPVHPTELLRAHHRRRVRMTGTAEGAAGAGPSASGRTSARRDRRCSAPVQRPEVDRSGGQYALHVVVAHGYPWLVAQVGPHADGSFSFGGGSLWSRCRSGLCGHARPSRPVPRHGNPSPGAASPPARAERRSLPHGWVLLQLDHPVARRGRSVRYPPHCRRRGVQVLLQPDNPLDRTPRHQSSHLRAW
jgi:hypothetical protein